MRGFRGSRAAQNVMAFRHGQHTAQLPLRNGSQAQLRPHDPNQTRPALPDWMKTPETRAAERMLAEAPKPRPVAPVLPIRKNLPEQQQPRQLVQREAPTRVEAGRRPDLKVVAGGKRDEKPARAVKAAAAKPKAKAKPKKAAAGVKKKAPAKRKAA